jgi:hypothetical protein
VEAWFPAFLRLSLSCLLAGRYCGVARPDFTKKKKKKTTKVKRIPGGGFNL